MPPAEHPSATRWSPDPAAEARPLRVAAVRCFPIASRLKRPFVTARRRTEYVESLVAEVELADGTVGQGSAAETVAVTGESVATMTDAVAGPLAAALTGATGTIAELAALVAGALPGNTSAKAAVEVALHDAWARAVGRPLVELFGGALPAELVHDMTVSLGAPATMAADAAEAVADGYGLLKIKLGADPAEDLTRLRAVVAAAPGVRLRLDANQGWTPDGALRIIDELVAHELPIDLVEQPVAKHDLAGLARVTARSAVPIMADEALASPADARRLVDAGAAHLFNIKLAKSGGLRPALEVADIAAEAGLACMVGAMMEPRVSICAAAHLAAAHPAVTMIDLDSAEWFADATPAGGYVTEQGRLRLLGGPGLGLDLLPATRRM